MNFSSTLTSDSKHYLNETIRVYQIHPKLLFITTALIIPLVSLELLVIDNISSLLDFSSMPIDSSVRSRFFFESIISISALMTLVAASRIFYNHLFFAAVAEFSNKIARRHVEGIRRLKKHSHRSMSDSAVISTSDYDLNQYVTTFAVCSGTLVSQVTTLLLVTIYTVNSIGLLALGVGILLLPLILVVTKLQGRKLHLEGSRVTDSSSESLALISDYARSFRDLLAFDREFDLVNRYTHSSKLMRKSQCILFFVTHSQRFILEFIFFALLSFALILVYFSGMSSSSSIAIPQIATLILVVSRFSPIINQLITNYAKSVSVLPSVKKSSAIGETRETNSLNIDLVRSYVVSERYFIEMDLDLNFRSFKGGIPKLKAGIQQGVLNLLCGESGAGKSTLLDLLIGLNVNISGRVVFGSPRGEPIRIGFVSQVPYIFNASVLTNIVMYNTVISYERVILSLKCAGFPPVELTENFLQLILVNQGENISVGMRMRIAIARILYHDFEVIFLDEPTAAIDEATKIELLNTIQSLAQERMVLVTSHDPSLIRRATNIIKLDAH